ncbi:MAG: hypothetical protein NT126_04190 [Bacteroidetes bacterium]|nr:hypothetical protein [Bacteroidota bacterium]
MKVLVKNYLPILFVLLFFSSCYYDNLEELHPVVSAANCDTTVTISYVTDVKPILDASCGTNTSCHSTASSTSGIPLDNYADVSSTASMIVKSITHDPSYTPTQWMPSGGGTLDSCSIKKVIAWVHQGKLNN